MAATDLERLIVQLEAQSTKLDKALSGIAGNVDRQLNRVEKRTDQMNQRVTAGFGRAGVAIAGFFSARAVIGFIARVSDAADKLQALSDRTGVGTDQLQKLAGAAAKANVDTEQLNDALDIFARNVGRATAGQGDLAKVMKDFGITAGDDLVTTLLDVADAVQKAKTTSEEYRITQAAFGRSSAELVGFLRQGRDAIREQADAFNSGISPDAVKRLAEFNQHWKEISVSFTNMAAGPASLVLKGLSDFLHDLESGGWRAGAQDLISILSGGLLSSRADTSVDNRIARYKELVASIGDLRAQLKEALPSGFTADAKRAADLTAEINAKEAELAALGNEIASRKVPVFTGAATAAKPFGAPAGESDADAKHRADAELRLRVETNEKLSELVAKSFEADAAFRQKQGEQQLEDIRRGGDNQIKAQEEIDQALLDERADFDERMQAAIDAADVNAAEKRQEQIDKEIEDAKTLRDRKIEAVRDTFANLATLSQSGNDTLAAIGKAAAIVTATIDGIVAVQKALASVPPPFNIALAASIGVATAANVAKIAAMEKGGIVGPDGVMPLRRYARGGVASGPQMALFGEGSMNEAFVPLPDGRRIPVTLKMPQLPAGSSSSSSIANTFHIDARDAAPGVERLIKTAVLEAVSLSERRMQRRLPDMMVRADRRKL